MIDYVDNPKESTKKNLLEPINELSKVTEYKINTCRDFPGGAVVKNQPANAGDTGLIPGPGRSHMPQSN